MISSAFWTEEKFLLGCLEYQMLTKMAWIEEVEWKQGKFSSPLFLP